MLDYYFVCNSTVTASLTVQHILREKYHQERLFRSLYLYILNFVIYSIKKTEIVFTERTNEGSIC